MPRKIKPKGVQHRAPHPPELQSLRAIVNAMIEQYDRYPSFHSVAPFIALLRQWEHSLNAASHQEKLVKRIKNQQCRRAAKDRALWTPKNQPQDPDPPR